MMNTTTAKAPFFDEGQIAKAKTFFGTLASGFGGFLSRVFEKMIESRQRTAMVMIEQYADMYGLDLNPARSEIARTMGSDEDTPRNAPHAGAVRDGEAGQERVTRF
jgi:hypothetical protein